MTVIQTSRLQMRRIEATDADFLVALMNDPAYIEHIGDRGLRTPAEARAYIGDVVLPSYRRHGYGMYLLTLNEDGPRVGIAGLVNRPNLADVDVGFAVARAHWGYGYASEAAAAVLVHAARDFGLKRVVGVVAPGNAASIRVLEKIGLSYEGRVRLTPREPPILLYATDLSEQAAGLSPAAS